MNNVESNKSHDHDMIRIRMLKLCGPSLCKHLLIIFKSYLSQVKFPMEWKKANVVPMRETYHKSASKTTNLSRCFRSAVRSLKDFYSTNCTSF